MGEYLSSPKKDKDSTDGGNAVVSFTVPLDFIIDEIRSLWDARLEKINGGCSYYASGRD